MKYIISWVLRSIPRKIIQLFAHRLLKIYSLFLKGNKVYCPVCDHSFSKFLPYGRLNPRENALCPSCLSLERHRLMYLFLKQETDFLRGYAAGFSASRMTNRDTSGIGEDLKESLIRSQ